MSKFTFNLVLYSHFEQAYRFASWCLVRETRYLLEMVWRLTFEQTRDLQKLANLPDVTLGSIAEQGFMTRPPGPTITRVADLVDSLSDLLVECAKWELKWVVLLCSMAEFPPSVCGCFKAELVETIDVAT